MGTRPNIAWTLALTAVILALAAGPAAAQSDVAAFDVMGAKPTPCPELATAAYPLIEGGCTVFALPTRAQLTVRTLFGPMRFARCEVAFVLHIAPTGDLWLQGMSIEGTGACGDILPCRQKAPEDKIAFAAKLPWKGTIANTSSDSRQSQLELCFDTCLGRFEGRTAFDLVKERGDWTMHANRAVAGESGLELDGEWDLDATGVGSRSSAYIRRAGLGAPGFDLR